jgi:hypothetical protein
MKYNRSYIYALPSLGDSYLQFVKKNPQDISQKILRNTYLFSDYMPDHKEHIFIEYKEVLYLKQFYQWLESLDNFINKYEVDDEEDTFTYCFKIPSVNKINIKAFKQSKYSEMNDNYKRHIIKFHNKKLNHEISKILYKDESLYIEREIKLNCDEIDRNQEIGELIDLDLERHKRKVELKKNNKQTVIFD